MIIIEDVEVKWNKKNKQHYETLGYMFTKTGDSFTVKTNELTKGSHTVIKVLCDYCKTKTVEKPYKAYLQQNEKSIVKKDCCKDCKSLKTKESNLLKYGEENVMHVKEHKESQVNSVRDKYGVSNVSYVPEIREKRRQTSLENYGVDSYFQTDEFKTNNINNNLIKYGVEWYTQTKEYANKVKNSSWEKYGVDHFGKTEQHKKSIVDGTQRIYGVGNVFQSEEIKEKIKNTNMNKYGVEYYAQTAEFAESASATWGNKTTEEIESINLKRQESSLSRYGTNHPQQNPDVKKKTMETLFRNGNTPSSKQQRHINELIGGTLNYPVGRSFLDIAFVEEKVFVEYDGGGHNLQVKHGTMTQDELDLKDKKRTFHLFDKGWKEIRLIARKDQIPTDKEIIDTINKARLHLSENKCKSVIIDWDSSEVIFSFKRTMSLGDFLNGTHNTEKDVG